MRLCYTRVSYLVKLQFLQISISPIPLFRLAAKRDAAPRHRVSSISIHDRSRQRGRHTSRERRDAMRRKTHRCNSHRHSPFLSHPSIPARARARASLFLISFRSLAPWSIGISKSRAAQVDSLDLEHPPVGGRLTESRIHLSSRARALKAARQWRRRTRCMSGV